MGGRWRSKRGKGNNHQVERGKGGKGTPIGWSEARGGEEDPPGVGGGGGGLSTGGVVAGLSLWA